MRKWCLSIAVFSVSLSPLFGEFQSWVPEFLEGPLDGNALNEERGRLLSRIGEEEGEYRQNTDLSNPNGEFLNPFTDICWKCVLPIRISGINILSDHTDFIQYEATENEGKIPENSVGAAVWLAKKIRGWFKKHGCYCGETHFGVPMSFWEPYAIVEITPTPYKSITFKGVDLSDKRSAKMRGGISHVGESGRTSFYHVHLLPIPAMRLLYFIPGFKTCMGKDISWTPYLSEWDPTWRYPVLSSLLSLEMYGKRDRKSLKDCEEDCLASNRRRPSDDHWWCAGCLGSYYPFVGHVAHHIGGVQTSSLLLHRALGLRHFYTWAFLNNTKIEKDGYCKKKRSRYLQKSAYKTHLIYPFPDKVKEEIGTLRGYCHPLGQMVENGTISLDKKTGKQIQTTQKGSNWGSGKTFPGSGEEFSYVVFAKMHCCYNFAELGPLGMLKAVFDIFKGVSEFADAVEMFEKVFHWIDANGEAVELFASEFGKDRER